MKIERILVYGLFSDGKCLGDWSLDEIYEKTYKSSKPFTYAEKHAISFFEEVGKYLGPEEIWKKPYGSVLNETRKLH